MSKDLRHGSHTNENLKEITCKNQSRKAARYEKDIMVEYCTFTQLWYSPKKVPKTIEFLQKNSMKPTKNKKIKQ